jgi:hypothetical protein
MEFLFSNPVRGIPVRGLFSFQREQVHLNLVEGADRFRVRSHSKNLSRDSHPPSGRTSTLSAPWSGHPQQSIVSWADNEVYSIGYVLQGQGLIYPGDIPNPEIHGDIEETFRCVERPRPRSLDHP